MKKALFVGCGLVLALVLGLFGFAYFVLREPFAQWQAATEVQQARLIAINEAHPFEAGETVDRERFTRHLELRVDVIAVFMTLSEEFARLQTDEELGIVDMLRGFASPMIALPEALIDQFEQAEMGTPEFAHHSRLLWAVMRELDKGTGGDRFGSVRGRYAELKTHYEEAYGEIEEYPALDDLIGTAQDFPQETLDAALHIMGQDLELLLQATAAFAFEPLALQLDKVDPSDPGTYAMPLGEANEGDFR